MQNKPEYTRGAMEGIQPKTFIFTGRSGSGKGTQARLLGEALKRQYPSAQVMYIETGARFREFISAPGYSNVIANEVYKAGYRQPDFLAVWNWSHIMVEQMTGKEHLIIDGTPRSYEEALVLDSAMTFYHRERPTVIHLDVSREWSRKHIESRAISEGRVDDQAPEEIARRLDWYETDVIRAVTFFENNKGYRYIRINGEQTIEQVSYDIHKALSE